MASRSISTKCIITSRTKSWSAAQGSRRWGWCRLRSTRFSPASRDGLPTSSNSRMNGCWKWASTSRSDVVPEADRAATHPKNTLPCAGCAAENATLDRRAVRAQIEAMTQQTEPARRGLDAIAGVAREASRKGPPPVHLWNPPFCGDLDMRIAEDGTWFYLKTPIGRAALVKLFASILKREGDKYFLVTPVEKCGIIVEDAPFLAVELKAEQDEQGQLLHFRTNVDDWVACGRGHALRFEPEPETGGLKPYLHIRRDLWAKVTRALFYDLVELGEEREIGGQRMFGVVSGGEFFAMAPAASLRDFR